MLERARISDEFYEYRQLYGKPFDTISGGLGEQIMGTDFCVRGALPVKHRISLNAKRHPRGGTGVAQCVDLFQQLRGEVANQADGARVALAHNVGGPTAVAAVTILEGPDGYGR